MLQDVRHTKDEFKRAWIELYPRGEEIADFLQPMANWTPELKPRLSNIEEKVREAVFWLPAPVGVLVITKSYAPLIEMAVTTTMIESLEKALGQSDWEISKKELSPFARTPWGALMGMSVVVPPLDALPQLICYATYELRHSPSGELVKKFYPMRDLWLAGNFPIGFDRRNNLLVLVAD